MPTNPIDPIDRSDRPTDVDHDDIAGFGTEGPAGAGGAGRFGGGGGGGLLDGATDVGETVRHERLADDMDQRSDTERFVDSMDSMDAEARQEQLIGIAQRRSFAEYAENSQRQQEEFEAAQAAGEAYYWGDEERDIIIDGEQSEVVLSKVTLSDGTTVWVTPGSDPPEVMDVQWADDAEFIYQGDYMSGGEVYQVIELPTGHQVLVDQHGASAGLIEDMPPDHVMFPDPRNEGEFTEAYLVPMGPPSYTTLVYDAATDELIIGLTTGSSDVAGLDLWLIVGTEHIDPSQTYSTYTPPGAEYVLVIDSDGNVVDSYVPAAELVWSFLGIVEYYDDGEVRIDLGPLEISVDVQGEDGGISITGDVLALVAPLSEIIPAMEDVAEVGLGVGWEDGDVSFWAEASGGAFGSLGVTYEVEGLADFVGAAMDGNYDLSKIGGAGVEYRADMDLAGYELDGAVAFGVNNEGNLFFDTDATVAFQLGKLGVEIDANFYAEIGNTFEVSGGYRGQLDMFGFYLERGEQFSLAFDDGALTATYETFLGAGHELLGGVRVGFEAQVQTDGTRDGTSGVAGVYGSVVDQDGEELFREGFYADTDVNGGFDTYFRDEGLDTGVTRNTKVFDDDVEMPLPSGLLDQAPDEIVPDDVFDDVFDDDASRPAWRANDRAGGPVENAAAGLDRFPGRERDAASASAGATASASATASATASAGATASETEPDDMPRVPRDGAVDRPAGMSAALREQAEGLTPMAARLGDGPPGDAPLPPTSTTIPDTIDPTTPIGAAGGGRPGWAAEAMADGPDRAFVFEPNDEPGPDTGLPGDAASRSDDASRLPERAADGVYVQETSSVIVAGRSADRERGDGPPIGDVGTRDPSWIGETEKNLAGDGDGDGASTGRPSDGSSAGPAGVGRPELGGDRVEGRLPGNEPAGPGLREQPDPEERASTGRPVRDGAPPLGGGDGDGEGRDGGPLGDGRPTTETTMPGMIDPTTPIGAAGGVGSDRPSDADDDVPPPDARPLIDLPRVGGGGGEEVARGVRAPDDDITSPPMPSAQGAGVGAIRTPAPEALEGVRGDRVEGPMSDRGPSSNSTDDITSPPTRALLPADRPMSGDRATSTELGVETAELDGDLTLGVPDTVPVVPVEAVARVEVMAELEVDVVVLEDPSSDESEDDAQGDEPADGSIDLGGDSDRLGF